MATLSDIKRRIGSVKSTQQITRAMKMVAAAKLRKAQERLLNARPYAARLNLLLEHVVATEVQNDHPLLAIRDAERTTYIVVTSDRGLCGSFNSNVIRRSKSDLDNPDTDFRLVVVGRKGVEHFSRRSYPIAESYQNLFDSLDFQHAVAISELVQEYYTGLHTDRVFIAYNRFRSAGTQEVRVHKLLPVSPAPPAEESHYRSVDYLYEPSAAEILSEIIPKNLNVQVWRILLESYSAEQGARMVAMDSATDAAQDMIDSLTLHYNKVRQAAITTEISEIVGGAEALQG